MKEDAKVGRPTKYRLRYCKGVIAHMSNGLGYQSYAGEIGVAVSTLYEWETNHPEFSDAKSVGYSKSLLFWEKLGLEGITGRIANFKSVPYIFTMKHRFKNEYGEDEQDKKQQNINITISKEENLI